MEVIVKKESKEVLDAWEIQCRAINQAIAICGTVQRLSDLLGLGKKGREQISKWRNERIRIPLQYAIEIEELTGVSFERLSPFTRRANKIISRPRISMKVLSIAVPCKSIIIPKNLLLTHPAERPIIVSADVTAYPLNQIYQPVPSELQSMDCIPWLPLFGGSLKFDNTLGHKLLF